MHRFISCDWGTSALRLRVVDAATVRVLAEAVSLNGISATFALWEQSGKKESERVSFYQSVISEQIKKLEEQIRLSLAGVTVIISGMASSTIGMLELPYKEIPVCTDGHDLYIKTIEASDAFQHPISIISGLKTANDVMRGEETQLVGCFTNENDAADQLFNVSSGCYQTKMDGFLSKVE